MNKHRYNDYKDDIDIDAFEAAIGFTPLRQTHNEDIGHCIFPQNHQHGDTTGKFAINRDKLVYNCWVCGGGSMLSLVMELYDYDIEEANEWLRQFALTDTRSDVEFRDYLLAQLEDIEVRTTSMPYFNARVLERFNSPVDYFYTRGISDTVIEQYHLCYSEKILKPAPIKQCGGESVKIDDDYYGPAAIFPHFWKERLVGWQYRWMEWDDDHTYTPKWLAKYTNTTDFPKSNTLFNYDVAVKAREPVVVVESVPTVLFLATHGIPAVSYFGSEPKPEQLRLLRRFSNGVILAPDNDKTGNRLLTKSTPYLERFIPVWHAAPVAGDEGADLGDYAKLESPGDKVKYHITHCITPSLQATTNV